jgi:hypothetical protein
MSSPTRPLRVVTGERLVSSKGSGSRAGGHSEPNFLVDDSRPPLPNDYVAQLEQRVAAGRSGDAIEYFLTTAIGLPPEFVAPMREVSMWPGMEAVAHTLAYDGTIVDGFTLRADELQSAPLPRWSSPEGKRPG